MTFITPNTQVAVEPPEKLLNTITLAVAASEIIFNTANTPEIAAHTKLRAEFTGLLSSSGLDLLLYVNGDNTDTNYQSFRTANATNVATYAASRIDQARPSIGFVNSVGTGTYIEALIQIVPTNVFSVEAEGSYNSTATERGLIWSTVRKIGGAAVSSITSLRFAPSANTFTAGTIIRLYGLAN